MTRDSHIAILRNARDGGGQGRKNGKERERERLRENWKGGKKRGTGLCRGKNVRSSSVGRERDREGDRLLGD